MPTSDPCVILPWDSDHFGVRIARLIAPITDESLRAIDTWGAANEINCVYALADSTTLDQAWLCEQHGFALMDVRMTLNRDLRAFAARDSSHTVRIAQDSDLPALRALMRDSFHDTRFYTDSRFNRDRADALYVAWLEKLYADPHAGVFVVGDSDVRGMIACELRDTVGIIQLYAVNRAFRGAGVGSALIAHALAWMHARGAESAQVVTSGRNISAQRSYQTHGFLTDTIQFWYHRWL
jgi:GNAT superfamily N-acetyltransferase